MFRFRVLSLLILVTVIGIVLAVYMVLNKPGDVSIRTNFGEILIGHDDIQFVDWDEQRYYLRPGLKRKLSERFHKEGGLIGGVPFQFCIDDDTIFSGRLTSSISSFGFTDIAIDLLQASPNDDVIELANGYPADPAPKRNADPRFRHRVYTSLWLDGKLNPTNGK